MKMNDLFMELYREKFGDHINKEIAEEIVSGFAITDGSSRENGERWTFDEAKGLGEKLGADWEKISKAEYYIVLNNMYSDYYPTLKKHGLPETILGEFALDWFNDKDAEKDKTFKYFMHL